MQIVIIISTASELKKRKTIPIFQPDSFSWNDRSSMCHVSNTPAVSLYSSVTSSQAHKTQSLVLSRLSFCQPPSPMLSLPQGHADYFFDSPACSKPLALFSLAVSDLVTPALRSVLRCTLNMYYPERKWFSGSRSPSSRLFLNIPVFLKELGT